MAKNSGFFTNKNMGIMLLIALAIEYVLPRVGVSGLGIVATILVLIVALMLLIK